MISIIVAMDDDQLIGKNDSVNGMPWSNKEDLKHFKNTTLNQTILMGHTTYDAIGKPLPNRKTIVISRNDFHDDRVEIRHSLEEVIKEYKENNEDLYICGGASIYQQALEYTDCLLISKIPGKHEGETYFPDFQQYNFKLTKTKQFETFELQIYGK
jgi:dihydrofolate reductase